MGKFLLRFMQATVRHTVPAALTRGERKLVTMELFFYFTVSSLYSFIMTRLAVLHRVTHPRCTVLHAEPPKTTWEFVGYFTKQRERRTDKWGRLDYDDQNIAEPAVFTDSAKAALAITAVARELGVPEDSIQEGLREIDVVLPGLELNPGTRARLAAGACIAVAVEMEILSFIFWNSPAQCRP